MLCAGPSPAVAVDRDDVVLRGIFSIWMLASNSYLVDVQIAYASAVDLVDRSSQNDAECVVVVEVASPRLQLVGLRIRRLQQQLSVDQAEEVDVWLCGISGR